jgi:hypothetical protein
VEQESLTGNKTPDQQYYTAPAKPNPLTRLALWSACIDYRLAPGAPYSATVFRYSVIGSLVLTSALFAYLTCTSFLTYFQLGANLPPWALNFLGVFWAFLIFNLERLILIAGSGSERLDSAAKVALALRVLIAVVLGLLLSEPLKLRMFRGDIAKMEESERPGKLAAFNTALTDSHSRDARRTEIRQLREIRAYFESLRDCETSNAANQTAGTRQYVECSNQIQAPRSLSDAERPPKDLFSEDEKREAIRKNSAIAVRGPLAIRSETLSNSWARRIAEFDSDPLRGQRLRSLEVAVNSEEANRRNAFEAALSNLTPLEAYAYLTKIEETKTGAWKFSLLVTAGFVLVDLIVLVAKLSFKRSIYDYRVDSLEGIVRSIEDSFKALTASVVTARLFAPAIAPSTAALAHPPSVVQLVDDALADYTNALGTAYRGERFTRLKLAVASAATTAVVVTWPAAFLYLERFGKLIHDWLMNFKVFRDVFGFLV